MITIAEQRRVYDAAVINHATAHEAALRTAAAHSTAIEARDKAKHQLDSAWQDLVEELTRSRAE